MNTVYVQDFEMLSSDSPELLGEFGSTLIAFLTAMELPDKIIRSVKRIDFRPAKVLVFSQTILRTLPSPLLSYGDMQ